MSAKRVARTSRSLCGAPPSQSRWDRYGSSVVADSRHLYVASRDRNLYALDLASGKEKWRIADRVFVGSRTYDLIALDAASGNELWKHYYWFSWIESPPVVREQVVYTGSSDGTAVFAPHRSSWLAWSMRPTSPAASMR